MSELPKIIKDDSPGVPSAPVKLDLQPESTTKHTMYALPTDAEYKALYMELIYAVGRKYEGETRHQTALRYIIERETVVSDVGTVDKSTQ